RDQLQAALLIAVEDNGQLSEELADWQDLRGDDVILQIGHRSIGAHLVTCRPEDHCIGAAHWVQFLVDASSRLALADFNQPAYFRVQRPSYRHKSPILSEEVRQSLLDDLELSEKDAA